nr:AAA family ATPase [Allobranchiibius huperziae]
MEQAHLTYAREQLTRMRERTSALDPLKASDADSSAQLQRTLRDRIAALTDDPRTTLFFGRLDLDASGAPGARDLPPTLHIGRRHISDLHGDPVVIDWRAPVSTAFYRASPAEPMGVLRRRRFGVDHGALTAIEDEDLAAPGVDAAGRDSRILAEEIERPRTGPMRDIVATIQPEQDEIVRAELGRSICVQGAPGTGKTAVGLHRAAWLLYEFRDRLERSGVLVIGPNEAFLDHIGAVLPALGEVRVVHTSLEGLVASSPVRGEDLPEAAALKGDARMAEVLRRAVWARLVAPTEALVVPRGVRRWRVPAYEVAEIMERLRARGVRYAAAGEMLPQRLAHEVLLQMEQAGDSPDDRVQDAVARSAPVRSYTKSVWPKVDPRQVLFELLSDRVLLAAAADGILTEQEQTTLLWPHPPRAKGSARWSIADLFLLDELGDVLVRTPSLGHVILDEAQDLSPMQLRAVGRRCATGSVTVLGDLAQGTTPWATTSWDVAMAHLDKPDFHLEELERGFRVPAAVLGFASRLLPLIAPDLRAPQAIRTNPGRLSILPVPEPVVAVVDRVQVALRSAGTVGVIVPDADLPDHLAAMKDARIDFSVLGVHDPGAVDHRVQLVPAGLAKGLEFDQAVVVEPARIVAAEPDLRTGLRRLYIVLTRAVSGLDVVHGMPLPGPLVD